MSFNPSTYTTADFGAEPAEAPVSLFAQRLVEQRWKHLRPEADDPLSILFDEVASEWTLGWAPCDVRTQLAMPSAFEDMVSLYAIVWKKTTQHISADSPPQWTLLKNGHVLFSCDDVAYSPVAQPFRLLFGSDDTVANRPRFMDCQQLLGLFHNTIIPIEYRKQALDNLCATMTAVPSIWKIIRPFYLKEIKDGLNRNAWPTLDLVKVHRMTHKTLLLNALCDWLSQRVVWILPSERLYLERLCAEWVQALQMDYETLAGMISGVMALEYNQSYERFKQIETRHSWLASALSRFDASGQSGSRMASSPYSSLPYSSFRLMERLTADPVAELENVFSLAL